jgi:antitoxin component YwqK of YwqJK toxin-antitoxin module
VSYVKYYKDGNTRQTGYFLDDGIKRVEILGNGYIDGKRVGTWYAYYENGIIKNKYEYGNNECREFIKYFADGKPNHKGLYIDKNNIDSIFY